MNGHVRANTHAFYGRTDRCNGPDHLVTKHEGLTHDVIAIPTMQEIVKVRAANTSICDAHEHTVIPQDRVGPILNA